MQNTCTRKLIVIILCLAVFGFSCKKKAAQLTAKPLEGVAYTDFLGNSITNYGDVSDDWTFTNNLTAREKALFDFPDDVDMTGTTEAAIPQIYPAYPNPAFSNIRFVGRFGTAAQLSKIKIVITDGFLNVAYRDAILIDGGIQNIFLAVGNRSQFLQRGIYRIYYSLSAKDKPNYKMGYGDFQICPGFITTPNCP